ncbi:Selenocysteine lyase/Cysteine desulfurase [Palleronia marisminoris]|uniref:aminotransferase class V-fold PLP-dependent enzyme n=1 Tax=Palleronia marisminoris TaxID=315423 RepID=UPI0008E492B5|nr:aminotransferase class V-fold PLP-dependent enzyme [Palleronia marisminoris]SFH27254.1 Selenocysteine lyase/Cysteine desulfurase [Palleronia marisminoris]
MSDGYFLNHSIGLYPGKEQDMRAATAAFAEIWAAPDDSQWPRALAGRAEFIVLWARLIGAPEGTVTTAESVTAALHSVLGGLPADRLSGTRVLVAADCFPSLHFLLSGLAERRGFTLDTVPLRPGESWVREEDMIARLGPDVALTLVTLVTSTAGYRADLNALLPEVRAAGSLVALDLTQGIGVVPFSVADHAPDIVVSTSLKWLGGAPGAGILHVAPELLRDCRPELRGWFSQPNPFSWDLDGFSYAPDARRFDAGTPAPLAAIASVPGLRWQAGQGSAALLAHAQDLGDAILGGLPKLVPASPTDRARRGGSVMLRLPHGSDPARIVGQLREAGLYVDARGAILRLSPGATTTPDAVDPLCRTLQQVL